MKYEYGFAVTIPWIDTNEDGSSALQRSLLHTNDAVDHRAIKRLIRTYVRHYLDRTLHSAELDALLKKVIRHKEHRFYVRQQ